MISSPVVTFVNISFFTHGHHSAIRNCSLSFMMIPFCLYIDDVVFYREVCVLFYKLKSKISYRSVFSRLFVHIFIVPDL